MATDFPNSPANGATHTFGGTTYTYSTSVGAWTAGSSAGGASVTVSETAPSSPAEGDLWFDPSVLKTFVYYNDGSANQWVQSNPTGSGGGSAGASVTASDTAPSSPSAGDLWYKSDTNALYVYYNDGDSSQWVGVSGPAGATGAAGASATGYGQVPIVYTEPPTTHALNSDGSTSSIQMQAVDPEGTSITYAIAYANATNARPNQLAADTTINQSTGTFTFDPSTNTAHEGTFKARLSASDGITHATRFVNVNLAFTHTLHWLVIAGGGGGGSTLPAYANGGGGGAGGYRSSWNSESSGGGASAESAIVGNPGDVYTITVGAGGTGATSSAVGTDGADSSLARTTGASMTTITSVGGGAGGFASGSAGRNGGSGGGGNWYQQAAGTGTANQGYDGGSGGQYGGGGGGGAGAVGANASGNTGGNGGTGVASTITGSSVERAGGGGGASGGTASGGGGAGATSPGSGTAGTANTGGGGGAGGITGNQSVTGGDGGSGVVIIRTSVQAASTTGSPVETTVGSDYVYQFNANGTITFQE